MMVSLEVLQKLPEGGKILRTVENVHNIFTDKKETALKILFTDKSGVRIALFSVETGDYLGES
jgi:hypothetical protein